MKDTAHRDPHRDKLLGDPMPFTFLPPGDYFAQAIVKVHEQVKRADGKTISISTSRGCPSAFRALSP